MYQIESYFKARMTALLHVMVLSLATNYGFIITPFA